jgi:hypothetical protein
MKWREAISLNKQLPQSNDPQGVIIWLPLVPVITGMS